MKLGKATFFKGSLFFGFISIGKNYSTELTLLQKMNYSDTFNLSFWSNFSRKVDHSPQVHFDFNIFGWQIIDFSFHNVNHAEHEEDIGGIKWTYNNLYDIWETILPLESCGEKGEWKISIYKIRMYNTDCWFVVMPMDDIDLLTNKSGFERGFNRYYFDIDNAKDEVRSWVMAHKEFKI